MRLGISMRGLDWGSYAVSTIVLHLARAIIELAGSRHEIFLYFDDPQHETLFPSSVFKRSYKLKNRFLWDHLWLPQALKKDDLDVALFMKGTMPLSLPCRGAVIFHDLGYFDHELSPYPFWDTVYMKAMMSKAASQTSIVFADSEYTRADAVRIFGIPTQKLDVCHQDCSPIYRPVTDQTERLAIRTRYLYPDQFIFCPLSISPRKNLPRILDAFEMVKDNIPHDLVITGGQSSMERDLVRQLHGGIYKRVHILGEVPHADMPGIYSLADFTLYPSLLEGFGLPVLEAFRCGCPVLTSNVTSIPEVAGDAAMLIDPYSTNQIADGMVKLANDPVLRESLIAKGFKQAKKFSWEKTAGIILSALEKAY
jgi:glycosyltransferase involved in cell wall biosynthesis